MSCCRRPIPTAKETAAGLLRALRHQYDRRPEFRDVEWPKHLTGSRFHRTTGDALAAAGFVYLGDFEETNSVTSNVSGVHVVDRVLRDAEGKTLATLRELSVPLSWRFPLWAMGVPREVVTFRSCNSAGEVYTTSNEPLQALPPVPREMTFDYVSLKTPLGEAYERHRRTAARLSKPLRRFETRADAQRLLLEIHARISSHLHEVGWATQEWLDARFSPAYSRDVYNQMESLIRETNPPVSAPA